MINQGINLDENENSFINEHHLDFKRFYSKKKEKEDILKIKFIRRKRLALNKLGDVRRNDKKEKIGNS